MELSTPLTCDLQHVSLLSNICHWIVNHPSLNCHFPVWLMHICVLFIVGALCHQGLCSLAGGSVRVWSQPLKGYVGFLCRCMGGAR